MAVSRILGVLSLVGALLLLSNALPFWHGSSRLRGPGAALADLLVDALDRLDGARLLDLATRRNMVLLCHAILLVLLGDAGILGVPAARRRRRHRQSQSQTAAEEATTTAACHYYSAAPRVVPAAAPVGDVARPLRQRLAVAVPAEPEHGEHVAVATKEIVLVEREKQQQQEQTHSSCLHLQAAAAAEPDRPAAAAAMDMGRALVLADPQQNHDDAAQGEAAAEQFAQEEEEEEEEDMEEMNRRFEAFIAATKEKMRLEALHPYPHPAPSLPHNTALLAR